MKSQQNWVVSQLGAREHYGVARALASQGALGALVTEAWAPPCSVWSRIAQRLTQRFHSDLAQLPVHAWTGQSIIFEALARGRGLTGWALIIARNDWFQRHALAALWRLAPLIEEAGGVSCKPTLFSYSYTALHQFRWAKSRGWRTVLGQIDPGPLDNELMLQPQPQPQPANKGKVVSAMSGKYLADWREECMLADQIVVNSEWSRQSLLAAGAADEKLKVVPLAFDLRGRGTSQPERRYLSHFDAERPLRVLFLGNLSWRKGVMEVFDAIRLLGAFPCEFWFVGAIQIEVPTDIAARSNVKLIGPVSRGSVANWYATADVFVFPTHSDGFGITQLEALFHGLPVIASRNCGKVIEDGVNGLLLEKVSGSEIADKIIYFLDNPSTLKFMMQNYKLDSRFSVLQVGKSLIEI
jgi:glycosyltransferase involved in cell wall biosynthesis